MQTHCCVQGLVAKTTVVKNQKDVLGISEYQNKLPIQQQQHNKIKGFVLHSIIKSPKMSQPIL